MNQRKTDRSNKNLNSSSFSSSCLLAEEDRISLKAKEEGHFLYIQEAAKMKKNCSYKHTKDLISIN